MLVCTNELAPFVYGVGGLTVVACSRFVAVTGALLPIPSSHPAPFDEGAFASSDNLVSDFVAESHSSANWTAPSKVRFR